MRYRLVLCVLLALLSSGFLRAQQSDSKPLPMARMLLPSPDDLKELGAGWQRPWEVIGGTQENWTRAKHARDIAYDILTQLWGMTSDEEFALAWAIYKPAYQEMFPASTTQPTRQQMTDRLDALADAIKDTSVSEYMRSQPDPAFPNYVAGINGFTDTLVITADIYSAAYIAKEHEQLDITAAARAEMAKAIREQKLAERKLRQTEAGRLAEDLAEEERILDVYKAHLDEAKRNGNDEQIAKDKEDVQRQQKRLAAILRSIQSAFDCTAEVDCSPINGADAGYVLAINEKDGGSNTVTIKAHLRVGRAALGFSRIAQGPYCADAVKQTSALIERLTATLAPFAATN